MVILELFLKQNCAACIWIVNYFDQMCVIWNDKTVLVMWKIQMKYLYLIISVKVCAIKLGCNLYMIPTCANVNTVFIVHFN